MAASRRGCQIGNWQLAIGNGFSLVEVLVVVSLLSMIVLALMTVFSSTQRAFRAAVTQTDVLEGSRAATDLMAADLRGMTPSFGTTNGAVNFSVLNNYAFNNSYQPLLQNLPGSSVQRTNVLNYFFILSRENTKWIGVGYVVDHTNTSTLYPLYRFYGETNIQTDPVYLIDNFFTTIANGQWTNMSHLIDGVANLTVRAYDTNGTWINNISGNYTNALNTRFYATLNGESQIYMFSNTVPASVELELGVIEDRTLARAASLPNNLPALPPNDRRSLFLKDQSGAVHLFRQRVSIPNVDPTAYQP